jgi:hypothetical protein
MITPGIFFLGRTVVLAISLYLGTVCLVRFATTLGISLPPWILLLCATSSLPIGFALHILYVSIFRRRQAARMGARLAFPLEGKRFGNLDIMLKLVERFNNGYPGMAVCNFCTLIYMNYLAR